MFVKEVLAQLHLHLVDFNTVPDMGLAFLLGVKRRRSTKDNSAQCGLPARNCGCSRRSSALSSSRLKSHCDPSGLAFVNSKAKPADGQALPPELHGFVSKKQPQSWMSLRGRRGVRSARVGRIRFVRSAVPQAVTHSLVRVGHVPC